MDEKDIFDILIESYENNLKIVYHGSTEPDLDEIEPNHPDYEGSLGFGVYTDYDIEVARFYGEYIYELQISLKDDDILFINAENVEIYDGKNSILTGEYIPPFSFYIRDVKYFVGGGSYAIEESELEKEIEIEKLKLFLKDTLVQSIDPNINTNKKIEEVFNFDLFGDYYNNLDYYEGWLDLINLEVENNRELHEEIINSEALEDFLTQTQRGISSQVDSSEIYGLSISLDDISAEASYAGYKAVQFEHMRGNFPDTELLILDTSIIISQKRIE